MNQYRRLRENGIDPFDFDTASAEVCTRWGLLWFLVMPSLATTSVVGQVLGREAIAMWAALALFSMAASIVACVWLSQRHQLALLEQKNNHEISKIEVKAIGD